jgi:uncharacterized DUF497 family protein
MEPDLLFEWDERKNASNFLRSGSEVFRLISARLATKREKELYFSQGGVHERGV